MSPADLEALLALADAATPGPWSQYAGGKQIYGGDNRFITVVQSDIGEPDAAFIAAANPDTIRRLLTRLREAEAALAAERERCAVAAEQRGKELHEMAVGSDIATTIRMGENG